MTNQAIILLKPFENSQAKTPLPFQEVNGKPFLHFQLQFLSDNLFEHIILVYIGNKKDYLDVFGEEYLGMKIIYTPYDDKHGQTKNILNALEFISEIYVFVFNSDNYFRLNITKADNYRRMRDAKILLIGKKEEGINSPSEKLFLNEKGKILKITTANETEDQDTFNTGTFLLNKKTFTQIFENNVETSLIEYLKSEHQTTHLYCLSCRQYFINISSNEDLERAKHDIEENYF